MGQREQAIEALEKIHREVGELLHRILDINQVIVEQRLLVPKLDYQSARDLHLCSHLMLLEMRAKLPKPARAAA